MTMFETYVRNSVRNPGIVVVTFDLKIFAYLSSVSPVLHPD